MRFVDIGRVFSLIVLLFLTLHLFSQQLEVEGNVVSSIDQPWRFPGIVARWQRDNKG